VSTLYECQDRAEECSDKAERSINPKDRAIWLRIADLWASMAQASDEHQKTLDRRQLAGRDQNPPVDLRS
jgi:hypothetical protein